MRTAKIFSLPGKTAKRRRISVRVPKKMIDDLNIAMQTIGLATRMRSSWISNSVIDLKKYSYYTDCVLEEWIESGNNTSIQISLNEQASIALDDMLKEIKNIEDNKSDMQSAIIRTAILQKLMEMLTVNQD